LSRDWLRRYPPAQPPAIDGRAAIVIDLDRRQILYEQSATTRYPVGSLAKLMTGMVADDIAPPGLMVTVPQGATGAALDRQGLSAGEQLSVHDLLTGLLLVSANDAAETLARGMVARARFIELMNQKASLMRLRDSAFIDPGGVDDGASFSSAQDMAVILATLLRDYPDLRQILGTRQVQLVGAGHKPYDLINADRLLWTYPGAIGGKPAYSGAAGYCLAAAATRQGRTVLAVVLGSDQHFTDAGALLDFGFRHLSS
jgi:D-alanyl-D-alanine carboxypeptidase (penicillin-binding protein 5/6)